MIKPLSVKVGVIQLEPQVNAYAANVERALAMIDECAQLGCRLVCLPEAFATTIDLKGIKEVAEEIPGKLSSVLCEKAKEKKVYLIAGILEKQSDGFYSSSILVNDEGKVLGTYRRVHIYQLEKSFINEGGDAPQVFDTPLGKISMIIGYDVNFPEVCRGLFQKNVEILVCPAQIPYQFDMATRLLVTARATENCCYAVLASSVGENILARIRYMGKSMIARSPVAIDRFSTDYVREKEVIVSADSQEEIITGDLDLKRIRREQTQNPQYKDARFDIFTIGG